MLKNKFDKFSRACILDTRAVRWKEERVSGSTGRKNGAVDVFPVH